MSPLSTFMTAWTATRTTFGDGAPVDGAEFDGRVVRTGQELARAAAPTGDWSGTGSAAYAAANRTHVAQLGAFADIDRRFGVEISRSAEVVAAGRRDLDAVRAWVLNATASVPNNTVGQQLLWSIVGKGIGDLQTVVTRAHGEQSAIADRIRALGDEYQLLGNDGRGGIPRDTPKQPSVPSTALDLRDIVYKAPFDPNDETTWGDPGYKELVPNSGVWVPDPSSRFYRPTPVEKPLDLDDIEQLAVFDKDGKRVLGPSGYIELVPDSGTWVPDPDGIKWPSAAPTAPVDLNDIEILRPEALGRPWQVELVPHSGVWVPNPHYGGPR